MPLIATGLYFLFAFIQKKPEMYNYVVQITEENAQKQYSLAIGLMRWLNFCLQLTFVLISKMMVLSSHTGKNPVPLLLLAGLIVILTLAPVIVYVKASIKNK